MKFLLNYETEENLFLLPIYVCRTTEGPKWEIVFQYQTYAGTDELNMAQWLVLLSNWNVRTSQK